MKNIYLITLTFLLTSSQLFSQNNCIDFDGTDDYVQTSATVNLSSSALTLEAWVYVESFQSVSPFISQIVGTERSDNSAFLRFGDVDIDNNKIQFVLGVGSIQVKLTSNSALHTNRWCHIAGTYDGANIRIYINGVEDASVAQTGSFTSNDKITIANKQADTRFFNGKIDEVRIWKAVARTSAQIRANMYKELSGSESGLIAYYNCNATSGTSLVDNSNNANTGTLNNMAGTEWNTSSAFFGPKNCLDFDGNDDYCNMTSNVMTNTDNFTMMAWVKPDVLTSTTGLWRCIAYNGDDAGGYGFGIRDGKVAGLFGEAAWHITDEILPATGVWYHIAMRRSNGIVQFFLNGKLLNYSDVTDPLTVQSRFTIGNMIKINHTDLYSNSFDGLIDEVQVYDIAITDQEIQENMCTSIDGSQTALVAYYNFDNSSGTVLQDFSGSANDLNLTNMDQTNDWLSSSAYNTWLNTDNSSWATATNWSKGIVPTSSDNIGMFSYLGGSNSILSGTPTMNNLVITGASLLTVSSDANVNGNLILLSNTDLNGNTITIANTGELIENGGLILGASGYLTFTESLSNITSKNIGGLGAEITCVANLGSTVVERYHTAITGPTSDNGIARFYKIVPSNNTGLNATLVFHYEDSELNGLAESDLVLYKSTDNSSTWTEEGGVLNTTNNTITLSNIDGFSWWTIAETGSTLPITLLSFSANCKTDNTIELNWSTASEINNSYFEIQQSSNAKEFTTVGRIDGAGNSDILNRYNFTYNRNENIAIYIRLKQVDYDGKFEYSNTITVDCADNNNNTIEVYPNPFQNEISINFNSPTATKAIVEIRNALGTVICIEELKQNSSNLEIHLKNTPVGIYYIVVYLGEETIIRKLVKD